MGVECTIEKMQIALASYDPKELRVQKNYLQEQSEMMRCACYQSGNRLLQQLQQGRCFHAVVLCGEMEDMDCEQFVQRFCLVGHRPPLVLFDEIGKRNSKLMRWLGQDACYCVQRSDLRELLQRLYQLPVLEYSAQLRCELLYEGWHLDPKEAAFAYLTGAVCIALTTDRHLSVRKELLQRVGEQYNASITAVDSSIRRLIDRLEREAQASWRQFKQEYGFWEEKPTTGKLIYAVRQYLIDHSEM